MCIVCTNVAGQRLHQCFTKSFVKPLSSKKPSCKALPAKAFAKALLIKTPLVMGLHIAYKAFTNASLVEHPNICRKTTKMCVWVYVHGKIEAPTGGSVGPSHSPMPSCLSSESPSSEDLFGKRLSLRPNGFCEAYGGFAKAILVKAPPKAFMKPTGPSQKPNLVNHPHINDKSQTVHISVCMCLIRDLTRVITKPLSIESHSSKASFSKGPS